MSTLTSFDSTFDSTFTRSLSSVEVPFPDVGGDGGGIDGAGLPFSSDPSIMAACLTGTYGQAWDAPTGLPLSPANIVLPFIFSVVYPDDISTTPYCTGNLDIVDANSGEVVVTPYGAPLNRMTDGKKLYIIHSGNALLSADSTPFFLPEGVYRYKVADMYSEPFRVACSTCSLLRVRLLNDTRIGELLYGSFGYQQLFYVEGLLSGPTYDESETRTGSDKTGATVTKIWTLNVENVAESVADAMAMAGLHRLVEVSFLKGDGSVARSIQALKYEAKGVIANSSDGGQDITLTLPVSRNGWSASGVGTATCDVSGTNTVLTVVECPE